MELVPSECSRQSVLVVHSPVLVFTNFSTVISQKHLLGERHPNNIAVDNASVKVVFFVESKVDVLPHLGMLFDPLDQRLHGTFPNRNIPVRTILELHLEKVAFELLFGVLMIGVLDGNTIMVKVESIVVLAKMELLSEKTSRFVLVCVPNSVGTKRRLRVVGLVKKIHVDQILDCCTVHLWNANVRSCLVPVRHP